MNSLKELPYLYRLPFTARTWGGGGGGAAGTIEAAGRQEQTAALQAADLQEKYLQNALGMLKPYTAMGGASTSALGSLWGLPGYAKTDPSAQLAATPGYQFLLQQAIGGPGYTGALGRYGASTGQAMSGNALKAATDRAQQMGLSYALQPYIQSLQFGAGQGLQAAGTGAGLTMGAGTRIGEYGMAAADANARAQIMAENARAANQGSMWGDILGLGGAVGGMVLGMPGVGSSIGKAIGGAIDNWGYQPSAGGAVPSFADGGYTYDEPIMVGERGPEVFIPDRPGFIVPNHLLDFTSFGRYNRGLYA